MLASKAPTPERLEKWARIRAAGQWHYVLSHGVLKLGTSLVLIIGGFLFLHETGLILLLTGGTDMPIPLPVRAEFWMMVLAIAVVCYPLGYVVGRSQWRTNEAWYHQYTQQQNAIR